MNRRFTPALALALALTAGCTTPDGPPAPRPTVVDSAGIEVVTNVAPTWPDGEGWTVDPSPELRIGSLDGPPETLFGRVRAVGWLGDGRIFVADEQAYAVRVFSEDGAFVGTAGGQGAGPGELQGFLHVRPYRTDSLFVHDYVQSAVSVFGPELEFARRFRTRAPTPVHFVRYALEDGRFVTFTPGETPADARGLVSDSSRIVVFTPDGSEADTVGAFRATVQSVAPDGMLRFLLIQPEAAFHASGERILWTRGEAFEYVEADADGTLGRIVRTAEEPVPVDDAIVREYQEAYMAWAVRNRPGMSAERLEQVRRSVAEFAYYPTLPATGPELLVDPRGNRWIARHHFEGAVAEAWEVFDSTGVWLGRIRTPPGLEVHAVGEDAVIGVATDEFGTPYVQVHPIRRPAG